MASDDDTSSISQRNLAIEPARRPVATRGIGPWFGGILRISASPLGRRVKQIAAWAWISKRAINHVGSGGVWIISIVSLEKNGAAASSTRETRETSAEGRKSQEPAALVASD